MHKKFLTHTKSYSISLFYIILWSFNLIKRWITRHSIASFCFLVPFLIFLIFFTLEHLSLNSFFTIDPNKLKSLIHTFVKALSFSLPIVLAFSYFGYRETKTISSKHQSGFSIFMYISSTIPAIIIGYVIKFFSSNLILFILWLILSAFSVIYLFYLVSRFLKSLSIPSILRYNKNRTKRYFKYLYYGPKNHLNNTYQILHEHLESIFQALEYSLDNKLEHTFKHEFDQTEMNNWNNILLILMEEQPHNFANEIYAKRLDKKDHVSFEKYYGTTVRNLGDLLFYLANDTRFNEIRSVLDTIKQLEPNKVPNLYLPYFQAIEEIAVKAFYNDNFPLSYILRHLLSYTFENRNETINTSFSINFDIAGSILIHQSLLYVAIENEDIQKITDVSYSMTSLVLQKGSSNISNDLIAEMNAAIHHKQVIRNVYKRMVLFSLFQGALKTIELGNYSGTGQLIKRITTDFNGHEINCGLNEFIPHRGEMKEGIQDVGKSAFLSILNTNFNFNIQSIDYCLQKLCFLLLAQQKYIVKNRLMFTEFYKNETVYVETEHFELNYLDYVLDKIIQTGGRYGLLPVIKKDFMKGLVTEIKYKTQHYSY